VATSSVDRLGRSLQELLALLGELRAKGVDLYLHQQGLDTSTPAGKAMFQMLGVFAEFERAMIGAGAGRAPPRSGAGQEAGPPPSGREGRGGNPPRAGQGPRHPCRGAGGRGRRRDGCSECERNLRGRRNSAPRPRPPGLPEADLLSWLGRHRDLRRRRLDDDHEQYPVVSRNRNEAASLYQSPTKFLVAGTASGLLALSSTA